MIKIKQLGHNTPIFTGWPLFSVVFRLRRARNRSAASRQQKQTVDAYDKAGVYFHKSGDLLLTRRSLRDTPNQR